MEVEKIETMVEVEADGWAVAMECRVERYLALGQNCGERDKIETDMDHLRVANRDGHRRSTMLGAGGGGAVEFHMVLSPG